VPASIGDALERPRKDRAMAQQADSSTLNVSRDNDGWWTRTSPRCPQAAPSRACFATATCPRAICEKRCASSPAQVWPSASSAHGGPPFQGADRESTSGHETGAGDALRLSRSS
jgi:hypothetical protein